MLAKLTSKNQLTLPKGATDAVESTEYFDVQTRDGQIILTPVRIQRGDAVRAKLAELSLNETDIEGALKWARRAPLKSQLVSEPASSYAAKPKRPTKAVARKK